MSLQGTVINGIILLDGDEKLPEGARVEVSLKESDTSAAETPPTFLGLLKFAGSLSDLPADFAIEHDHYIHGTPKRNRAQS